MGPSLKVDADGQLTANGEPVARLPVGQWVHVEIHCGLGTKANGRYDLTLTLPGEAPKAFPQLPCGSEKFNRLEWLGFTGLSDAKTASYLDNVKLDLPDR